MTEVPISIFEDSGIKKISLPNSIKLIKERAFRGSRIEEVVLPESVETIEVEAFYECERLTKINFPNSLKRIEQAAFSSCFALAKIELPKHLEFEGGCFAGTAIESLCVPEAMTTIPACTFSACKKLKEVTMPKGVKRIEFGAFGYTESLEKIVLSEGLEEIANNAFNCCKAVYSNGILIPKTVKKIGEFVFGMPGWEGLKTNLKVYKNSYAEQYAKENGIDYEIID